MNSRSLHNVVNDQTIALNALIYGYAGHSLVTPQHALQQVWWTDERIECQGEVTPMMCPLLEGWATAPLVTGRDAYVHRSGESG